MPSAGGSNCSSASHASSETRRILDASQRAGRCRRGSGSYSRTDQRSSQKESTQVTTRNERVAGSCSMRFFLLCGSTTTKTRGAPSSSNPSMLERSFPHCERKCTHDNHASPLRRLAFSSIWHQCAQPHTGGSSIFCSAKNRRTTGTRTCHASATCTHVANRRPKPYTMTPSDNDCGDSVNNCG